MKWPPLPTVMQGLAGPIKIDRPIVVDPNVPGTMGMWYGEERRIAIRSTLKREAAWQTLAHELGHAALSETGLRISHEREEVIVESIASGMMHVFRHMLTLNE